MDLSGKQLNLQRLRERADTLRSWLYNNIGTQSYIYEEKTREYNILCVRIYIIEKQW